MKLLIIALLFSVNAFSQDKGHTDVLYLDKNGVIDSIPKKPTPDTVATISVKQFQDYLNKINNVIKKQFDLSDESVKKYEIIQKYMNAILAEEQRKLKK